MGDLSLIQLTASEVWVLDLVKIFDSRFYYGVSASGQQLKLRLTFEVTEISCSKINVNT